MLKKVFLNILLILCSFNFSIASDDPCEEFNLLYSEIKSGQIIKEEAVIKINDLIPRIRKVFSSKDGREFSNEEWIFPLRGYGSFAIAGVNGNGYVTDGYNFFDGNKSKGHPGHDILILDKNLDGLDDETTQPADVLSMSSGVVVALSREWDPKTDQDGIFVMIYDTYSNALFCYANNSNVNVNLGDVVAPGDKIAEAGRTGLNASKENSLTHLQISYFVVNDGDIKPDNIYNNLMAVKIKK